MSDRNLDPRAVAERLRRGEHVSLSQLRGSTFPELENFEPKMLTEQLISGYARTPPADGRLAPRDVARAVASGELIRPDNVVESTPAADRTVSIAIQPDSTLRLVWTGPGAGSYDYVALFDGEPTDPSGYLTNQWCWAINHKDGYYDTGTKLQDIGTRYWVAYVRGNGPAPYSIAAKQQIVIPAHDVSASCDAAGTITLQWTKPAQPSYYDYIALYDREPTDPKGYLSSQWCWALNHTNGQYTTATSLKDLSTPYWVAYITNHNGAYRITTKKQLDLPTHEVFLTERHESYYDDSTSIERNVAVLNWTNPEHVAYYDYLALYDHKPDDALGYLSQQWNWAVKRTDGKYQTTTQTDPVNSPTKYWLAYVSNVEGKYQIVKYNRMNYEPTWMGDLSGSIAARKLREVVLPGSHDCGTCGITANSSYTPDSPTDKAILKPVVALWATTQQLSITAQLEAGVRYLDLRVWYDAQKDDFYTCHALRGTSIDEVLDSVVEFIGLGRKEIVLLDFNHFYALTPALHQRLATKITSKLGGAMLDGSAGVDVTVQDIWNRNKNVIAVYHDNGVVSGNSLFWPASKLDSPWPDQANATDLKNWLDANVIRKPHPNFWVLQGVITPDWKSILGGIFTAKALCDVVSEIDPQVVDWVEAWKNSGTSLNIVMLDFTNLCRLVPAVIAMNR